MARRSLFAVIALAAPVLLLAPGPSAADQPRTSREHVQPAFEAWYQADPTCASPLGCLGSTLPVPPPTVYPARTMHVGTAAGQEVARTYLAFFLDDPTAEVTAARLDVPLDTDAASGSQVPDQSRVEACLYTGSFVAADGSLDTPPEADCSQNVVLTYVAEPQPHLTGDLAPLAPGLAQASGIVLLPAPLEANAPTAGAWQVVFSASDRKDAPTPPASLVLTTRSAQSGTPDDGGAAPTGGGAKPPRSGLGFGGVDSGGSVEVGAAPVGSAPPVGKVGRGRAAGAPAPVAQPAAEQMTEFVGYAYKSAWLLPLLIAALVVVAGRELTRDLGAPRR